MRIEEKIADGRLATGKLSLDKRLLGLLKLHGNWFACGRHNAAQRWRRKLGTQDSNIYLAYFCNRPVSHCQRSLCNFLQIHVSGFRKSEALVASHIGACEVTCTPLQSENQDEVLVVKDRNHFGGRRHRLWTIARMWRGSGISGSVYPGQSERSQSYFVLGLPIRFSGGSTSRTNRPGCFLRPGRCQHSMQHTAFLQRMPGLFLGAWRLRLQMRRGCQFWYYELCVSRWLPREWWKHLLWFEVLNVFWTI